jgi:hypothetical protein
MEQRLALRLDPRSIRARADAAADAVGAPQMTVQSEGGRFVVDGGRDPQLFLPWELFGNLVGSVRDDSVRERERLANEIAAFGWKKEQFWQTLGALTSEYQARNLRLIQLMQTMESLPPAGRRAAEARVEAENIALCGMRADALVRARAHFGAEEFDRFLYTAVAPHMQISSSGTADEGERRRLMYVEGGCR